MLKTTNNSRPDPIA